MLKRNRVIYNLKDIIKRYEKYNLEEVIDLFGNYLPHPKEIKEELIKFLLPVIEQNYDSLSLSSKESLLLAFMMLKLRRNKSGKWDNNDELTQVIARLVNDVIYSSQYSPGLIECQDEEGNRVIVKRIVSFSLGNFERILPSNDRVKYVSINNRHIFKVKPKLMNLKASSSTTNEPPKVQIDQKEEAKQKSSSEDSLAIDVETVKEKEREKFASLLWGKIETIKRKVAIYFYYSKHYDLPDCQNFLLSTLSSVFETKRKLDDGESRNEYKNWQLQLISGLTIARIHHNINFEVPGKDGMVGFMVDVYLQDKKLAFLYIDSSNLYTDPSTGKSEVSSSLQAFSELVYEKLGLKIAYSNKSILDNQDNFKKYIKDCTTAFNS